jgi:hypothetical protein
VRAAVTCDTTFILSERHTLELMVAVQITLNVGVPVKSKSNRETLSKSREMRRIK